MTITKQKFKFKQTEIGMIPEDWEVKNLGSLGKICMCKRVFKNETNSLGEIPFYKIKTFGKKADAFIPKELFKKYKEKYSFPNKGDILLSTSGTIGRTMIFDGEPAYYQDSNIVWLKHDDNKLDNKFLLYCYKQVNWITEGSTIERLYNNNIEQTKIPYPSLTEQQSIAKILSDLDSKIELNQQMNKTLEEIGQAIFKHWFIDFEFPNEEGKPYKSSGGEMVDSEMGKIPKGWKVKPIDEVADFLNGLALQKYPPIGEDYLPVIKIRELKQGISDSSDRASSNIPKEYIINDGAILFSWSGSLEVAVWTSGQGALNQHLFKISSEIYPKWFYYYWTLHYLPEYKVIAEGKATTMGHIQRHHLKDSLVLIPNENTLNDMDKLFTPLINKIIKVNTESRKLSIIRDSLLPKLMSGKIRVPVEVRT